MLIIPLNFQVGRDALPWRCATIQDPQVGFEVPQGVCIRKTPCSFSKNQSFSHFQEEGFEKEVILFATSCCPDEINRDLDDEVMSSLFS
jgi:hypothetical protein